MTKFDTLYEKTTRTIKRTERYPSKIRLATEFLDILKDEYEDQYEAAGNRNFHSNFLKALSFKLDDIRAEVEEDEKDRELLEPETETVENS